MIIRITVITFLFSLTLLTFTYAQTDKNNSAPNTITSNSREILGDELSKAFAEYIDKDQPVTWEIDIPDDYDPENPPGVMVYVSPQNHINIPTGWLSVTKDKNLIWIAARMSGNDIVVNKRIIMAIMTLPLIKSKYKIDPKRIYISGFSGGGRVASMVASTYPHLFKGSLYICGTNFWQNVTDEQLADIKKNRFVFLTGSQDFNLEDTKKVYRKYKKADVNNIKLMVINRMGHSNPKRNKFKQAIEFLDNQAP